MTGGRPPPRVIGVSRRLAHLKRLLAFLSHAGEERYATAEIARLTGLERRRAYALLAVLESRGLAWSTLATIGGRTHRVWRRAPRRRS